MGNQVGKRPDHKESSQLTTRNISCIGECGKVLLDDVSINIKRGSNTVIIGPNGAGKSTLLNVLSGLRRPSTGTVFLDDSDLNDLSPQKKAMKIAVVGQLEYPDTRLTVQDYVELGRLPLRHLKDAKDHQTVITQVMNACGLERFKYSRMGQLSGGERQRAFLARSIVQEPSILFLDEPTNHLDPLAKGELLSIVANLGITIVSIIHDVALIPNFATDLIILKDARLQAHGTVAETLTPEQIHRTFGVAMLQLPAPDGVRTLPYLDIPVQVCPDRLH